MVNINQKMIKIVGNISLTSSESIHTLAKRINFPYTSMYRHLVYLNKWGIIKFIKRGQANFVELNLNNEQTRCLLSLASFYKAEIFLKNYPVLKLIKKAFDFDKTLILFGSYSKGNVRVGSDIDLCIINLEKEQERVLKQELRKIETLHKIEINCLFFNENEFKEMLSAKTHNIGKEILLNHVVLANAYFWYNLIWGIGDELRI